MQDEEKYLSENDFFLAKDQLPRDFCYPKAYQEYLRYVDAAIEADEDVVPLGFLSARSAANFWLTDKRVSKEMFLPFLQEDDLLYCFATDKSGEIYVLDLNGENETIRPAGFNNFVEFINSIRIDNDLAAWVPSLS